MNDPPLPALAMSQTKNDLLRHLNLSTDVYARMAVSRALIQPRLKTRLITTPQLKEKILE